MLNLILIIGLSGIVAQTLLLRELLINFSGNELALGIIFSCWVLAEATGALTVGRIISRIKNKYDLITWLQICFTVAFILSIFSCRFFRPVFGIASGETTGILTTGLASLLYIFLPAFCHGALFSVICSLINIGRAYSLETLGTLAGGIALTYIFLPNLNSFQTALLVCLANLLLCLYFFRRISLKTKITCGLAVLLLLMGTLKSNQAQLYSINQQFKPTRVLDYRNSPYGNICVGEKNKQYTFFYNGAPLITVPKPDIFFVEEFGNLPLLFHPNPQKILIIQAGAGGLINEILKYPVEKIDYLELDPLLIQEIKKFPTELTSKELTSPQVKIFYADHRDFFRRTKEKYDCIFIGIAKPSNLTANRLFSQEFFAIARQHLASEGILTFNLPGSLTYLSQELKDLNSCVLNACQKEFPYLKVIPGDNNLFLASGSNEILKISSQAITERIKERGINTNIFTSGYLNYRLSNQWLDWFKQNMRNATRKINQDSRPIAVLETLALWNKQYNPGSAGLLRALTKISMKWIIILIAGITCLIILLTLRRKNNKETITMPYAIFTTGFFGMLITLILNFNFQLAFGYLYQQIGLLLSLFMAGSSIGSLITVRLKKENKPMLRIFLLAEASIIAITLTISGLGHRINYPAFLILFFTAGLPLGFEFALAGKISWRGRENIGAVAGRLYFFDLLGGLLAGVFSGILLLPALGITNSCLIIAVLKISSIIIFLI